MTTRSIQNKKKPMDVYVSTKCGLVYIINFYSRIVDKIIQVNSGSEI